MTILTTSAKNLPKQSRLKIVGRPKSSQKRKQILHHAGELFLQQGYDRTSMDAVAKQSCVSKQTVYSHFQNKDVLYNAVIESKCEEYRIEEAAICIGSNSLDEILYSIAFNFIQLLNDKRVIAMYSVVIGESKNNLHLAQLFYDAGPLHSINLVKDLLIKHPQSGLLECDAKELSTDFFNLLKGNYHMLSMLGLAYEQKPEALEAYARKVVAKTLKIAELFTY
ncbi:TetR/AcrR family transcriptional regulator [Brumicola pallidula]|jgi:TetR/AcrR family transcriptional repressor of mexJK operon|uniref:Transcriptional regulator, TetR family protein n=1 Tax=Brumicola pallidula DSM 14239 = ACAM 615 TaxID=1121922 RepID=K6ZZN8_9ALTE|nr:TetR/AcrR family transcriptional regulator [Glaciecola pallidula]GAC28745.1 transcriptional regulator, TetR family protein [Glaciecola pallidula DSM 14239 = ACAM 615]